MKGREIMDFKKLVELRNMGFNKDIGISFLDITAGYAKGELVLGERHMNPIGSVHGGVMYTMADIVGGTAATSRGRYVTTVSGNMYYLRPAINCKKLIAETKEIKTGKNMCVYQVMITNENGTELAMATLDYYYLREISAEDFLSLDQEKNL